MTVPGLPGDFLLNVAVLLVAVALDCTLPEPPARLHPVVWMGKVISLLERLLPKQGQNVALFSGCVIVIVLVGTFGVVAWLVGALLESLGPIAYVLGGALILRTTFTVRGLAKAAEQTRRALEEEQLAQARSSLKALVSRDAQTLTPPLWLELTGMPK